MTHRYHAGHDIVIEERLHLMDGKQLAYCHEITGPDGTKNGREVTFSVEPK